LAAWPLFHIHVNAAFTLPCVADTAVEPIGTLLFKQRARRVTGETMTIHPTHLTTNLSRFGAKAFSQMNSSMIVKNGIVATVSVGSIAALSHLTHRDMGNATMM
jgi:hypothetical protein